MFRKGLVLAFFPRSMCSYAICILFLFIKKAAVRILTRTSKSELPDTCRIYFKVRLLVYKSLNCLVSKYIADMLPEYKPNRSLRSLGSSQFEKPRVHTKQGECDFSFLQPAVGISFQKISDVLKH